MRFLTVSASALFVLGLAPDSRLQAAGSCAALSSLSVPHVKITSASAVEAGPFTVPGGAETGPARQLPAFCRVAATLTPTADSDIKIEVWMPASAWNGKFQAVGNGAFNGSIAYPAMMTALLRGYATSSTDTGHTGNNAKFAQGHPEKVVDFAWRAVHEMTTTAKQVISAYYLNGPKYSYWNGCSAGGREAMKEAQRFPADFDGIIAGAPGLDWTGRATQAVRVMKALDQNEAARLPPPQAQLLHRAVLNACDALDGVKDGLIADPSRCTYDAALLQCDEGQGNAACLTSAQVKTAQLIYSPVVNSKTRREIAGLAPGSELGWTPTGWTASARATGVDQYRFLVFDDPAWEPQRFNPDTDVSRAEDADAGTINALDPNLKPFIDRGGKLIQYHGWSDPQNSPYNSTQYYTRVVEAVGDKAVRDAYRLFMAPGMGHCSGGEGPSSFDMVGALEQWVEHGQAPDQIVASHSTNGVVDRTRPLCPYPAIAAYKGSGSIDAAANFTCQER